MDKTKCKRCGHEWMPRVKDPIECPNCKSRAWKPEKKKVEEAFE